MLGLTFFSSMLASFEHPMLPWQEIVAIVLLTVPATVLFAPIATRLLLKLRVWLQRSCGRGTAASSSHKAARLSASSFANIDGRLRAPSSGFGRVLSSFLTPDLTEIDAESWSDASAEELRDSSDSAYRRLDDA